MAPEAAVEAEQLHLVVDSLVWTQLSLLYVLEFEVVTVDVLMMCRMPS